MPSICHITKTLTWFKPPTAQEGVYTGFFPKHVPKGSTKNGEKLQGRDWTKLNALSVGLKRLLSLSPQNRRHELCEIRHFGS